MIQVILFDLGDTLYRFESNDPRHYFQRGVRLAYEYLREQGLPLPPLDVYARRVYGRMLIAFAWSRLRRREVRPLEALNRIHRRLGLDLDPATTETLACRYFEPMRAAGRLDPDALGVLSDLRAKGFRLGIISNTFTPPVAIDDQLRADGILDCFPVRVYSCAVGYMKPNRRIFQIAFDALGVAPAEAAYVGDRPRTDVRGAARAGAVTVLKLGDRTPRWRSVRADYVIRRLTELPALFDDSRRPCIRS